MGEGAVSWLQQVGRGERAHAVGPALPQWQVARTLTTGTPAAHSRRASKHSVQLLSNQHPQLTMVTGTPPFSHCMNEMCSPARSASVAVTMLAEAPIRVPLPPKQAPKLRAQARICADSKRSRVGDASARGQESGGQLLVVRSCCAGD